MLYALEGLVDEKIKQWLRKWNNHDATYLQIATEIHRGQQAIGLIENLVEYGADLNERDCCTDDASRVTTRHRQCRVSVVF